jgi:GntR family transcriptional repressor for pyruvate dehydrogenase complex
MGFAEVVRNPVYLQVAEQIREAILDRELVPGTRLPTERELAAQFGVSRTTIREALRALQAQGLLTGGGRTTPLRTTVREVGSGPLSEALSTVVRLRTVSLGDLVELRCALESAALGGAARGSDGTRLEEARAALAEMRRDDVTPEEFHEADVRFHVSLAAASGNEAMHLVMLAIRDAIASHLLDGLHRQENGRATLRRLVREHAAILQAVEEGDGKRAGELVRSHVMGFYRRYLTEAGR